VIDDRASRYGELRKMLFVAAVASALDFPGTVALARALISGRRQTLFREKSY